MRRCRSWARAKIREIPPKSVPNSTYDLSSFDDPIVDANHEGSWSTAIKTDPAKRAAVFAAFGRKKPSRFSCPFIWCRNWFHHRPISHADVPTSGKLACASISG